MKIAGIYSFNKGEEEVEKKYPRLLEEIKHVISNIDSGRCKVKVSKEKTMRGKVLFDPKAINKEFKKAFDKHGWTPVRVPCEYPKKYFVKEYHVRSWNRGAFREIDFVKEKLGVEVQFGKYAFMVYNVCAKMTIFRNLNYIDTGVEIVPVKAFADEMSTGVSYYEQFLWDLEARGVADIDIPVLILGIDG
jgi:hypothetical protein